MMLRGFLLILSCWGFHMTKSEQIAHRVSACPQSKAEWQKASKRINCSEDYIDPTNMYHCLPDDRLTTLLEFCYSRNRTQVVKGLCMVFLESKNRVTQYDCSRFKEGCPNAVYDSDEMYKFPACTEIDPIQHCYKAEPSCQQKPPLSTVVEDIATLTTSSSAPTIETNNEENNHLVVVLPVTFGCLVLIICIFVWRMRKRRRRYFGLKENITADEMCRLLTPEQRDKLEEIEADIKRLKIDYLLQELPSDRKLFSFIAQLLKIPQEILYWSLQDRGKFVSSMKAGTISVYIGRGMVIGCAEAGKTTLVKKLKGEKNLSTESTIGIEIHTHIFKLNANESTITDCDEQEQKKGCVCLTPITLTTSTETVDNEEKRFLSDVSEEGVPNNSIVMSPLLTQTQFHNESHDGMNNESDDGMNKKSHDGMNDEMDLSQEVEKSNIESEQTIDFNACTTSVNAKNLKMISLLDFAGHSAYYACHHIFFSPRAFFILVIDITKEFKSVANKACPNENLIYSNWKYEDYIRYWLGSIHTYSSKTAPVILVGSHAECCNGDPKKARQFFFKVLNCLPEVLQNHVDPDRVFLIEKEKKKNMEDLRKCIASLIKSQGHWGENIPIAWAKLESVLKKLQEGSKIYSFYRLLKDVQKTNDLSINNEEELINALTFFHETGAILFRSEIKHIIILDVQWFVNALKCIILEEDHVNIIDKSNRKRFKELNEFGLLSSDLLNILWEKGNFNQYQYGLIDYIKQLDILAELSEDKWYVPCMNKQTYNVETLNVCNVSSTLCFLFEFLPFVVFHRLVVACINQLKMEPWKRSQKMCIFHRVAILNCLDQAHRVLIGICENKDADYPYSIEIQTNVTKPNKVDNQFSSSLKGKICKILFDLTHAFPSCDRSFKVGYRCNVKPFSGNPEDHIIREEDILRKSEVDCSKCPDNHIVNVGSIMCFWEENTDDNCPDFKETNEDYGLGPVEKIGYAECKTVEDFKAENEEKSDRYLKYHQPINKYFVKTKAYEDGERIFDKYNTVVWTGRPGCGKTLAAIHLILKQKTENKNAKWIFRKISSCDELSYIEREGKALFFIDNIFYQTSMDTDIDVWWNALKDIHNSFSEKQQNNVCFIFTARKTDIERAEKHIGNLPPILNKDRWINLDSLTEDESIKILLNQIDFVVQEKKMPKPSIDKEFIQKKGILDGPIGFPFCAQLFVCNEEYRKSGVQFFSRPTKYLKDQIKREIKSDKTNRTKTLFFVLFFNEWHTRTQHAKTLYIDNEHKCTQLLDDISPELRKHFAPFDFRYLHIEALRHGAFLQKEENNVYKFVHDSVNEAVGAFLCEQYVAETAKYFPLGVIQNQEYNNITDNQAATLALRLLYEVLYQNISQVFASKVFQYDNFVDLFSSELQKKEDKIIGLFFTVTNNSSPVKLPCMFWTSYNKLARLTDKFYDIVQERNIDPVFQLYVSLYGECCAVCKTIIWMRQNKLAEIRQRVLNFQDDDGNSILHLLITSERSEQFICVAVDQLLKDGINVDRRNKNKMTPLMFAVDQTKPRKQVVQKLISPKVHQTDSQKRTVFHHCLESCNDDETCAEYLNIILSCNNADKCLIKNDSNGNTALCIAAMETNYSRIISILILLQSGSKDIITTVNDDGFSPLHLSARSLTGDSPYIELECCVRVILLLLYGGTTDNKSDTNADAIEECQYDLVKRILKTPKDETEMTKVLNSLLGKCEEGRSEMIVVKSSLLPNFPEHISNEIQICINKATQILKNKTFSSANLKNEENLI